MFTPSEVPERGNLDALLHKYVLDPLDLQVPLTTLCNRHVHVLIPSIISLIPSIFGIPLTSLVRFLMSLLSVLTHLLARVARVTTFLNLWLFVSFPRMMVMVTAALSNRLVGPGLVEPCGPLFIIWPWYSIPPTPILCVGTKCCLSPK